MNLPAVRRVSRLEIFWYRRDRKSKIPNHKGHKGTQRNRRDRRDRRHRAESENKTYHGGTETRSKIAVIGKAKSLTTKDTKEHEEIAVIAGIADIARNRKTKPTTEARRHGESSP